MSTVNVDMKLGVNKFFVDEGNAHIKLVAAPNEKDFAVLELVCPAALYKRDAKGGFQFDYAGCLECGTCRVVAPNTVVESWEYPQGSLGVEFRLG